MRHLRWPGGDRDPPVSRAFWSAGAGLVVGCLAELMHRYRSRSIRGQEARASASLKAKSEFLSLAAHEIRTPLAVGLGYLDMTQHEDLGALTPEATVALAEARAQLMELGKVVDALMEAARMQDGAGQLDKTETDLCTLVADVVRSMRSLVGPKHNLVLDLPDEPLSLQADGLRLRAVIRNLLENAIKYSPEGGEVLCRLRPMGGRVEISVTDHGLGISTSASERIFGRFTRGFQRGIPGTGLGLYLARSIAEAHGGRLYVHSDRGTTTFTLVLPMAGDHGLVSPASRHRGCEAAATTTSA